jgi:DNA (cytosine-5)-methyltransferase 1
MKVLDLFSGVGGFSIGLEKAGMETVAFCEIDKKAQLVLKKHWPSVPIFEDIKTLKGEDVGAVDVICGGFPCQDLSTAGTGKGLKGERSGLWFEFQRLINEIRPKYAIIENVSVLRSRGLETVLRSLSEVGYDAQWHCISASSIGAPHQRDRVWIIAYPNVSFSKGRSLSSRVHEEHSYIVSKDWWKSSSCIHRVDDGVPKRVDRLKQLGNAVVPFIPELLGRAIMQTENDSLERQALLLNTEKET